MNMTPRLDHSSRSHGSGFTLIEVLVAVFILSIGLLGLASLQTTSLGYTHSAYLRSQASILAQDIGDRMRANRATALSGTYDIAMGTTPATQNCEGPAVTCTPAQLAIYDLGQWKTALAAGLPAGNGSIGRTVTTVGTINYTVFTITIQWSDLQTSGVRATQQFVYQTML